MSEKEEQNNKSLKPDARKGESAEQYKNRKWVCIAVMVCFVSIMVLLCFVMYLLAYKISADDFGEYMASLVCAGATFVAGVGMGWASRGGYEKFWRKA